MTVAELKTLISRVYNEVFRTRIPSVAGGLAYFFLLSLFPLLIVAATLLGFLPIPNLFERGIDIASRFVPPDAMGMVKETLKGILSPQRGKLLSLSILGTIWTATGGFSSLIEALDIAYDARSRSFLKQRAVAITLTFLVGGLFTIGLIASILGPRFGFFLSDLLHLQGVLATVWPAIRWGTMVGSVVLALELLYYFGPNVKQRFHATLPGAVLATSVWLFASYLLGIYFSHFAQYNKTYGSIGAVIALMFWLYVTSMIILVGAEVNSELAKLKRKRLGVAPQVIAEPKTA
jgi:membrane protein